MKNNLLFLGKTKSILMIFMLLFVGFLFLPQHTKAQMTHQVQVVTCWETDTINLAKLLGIDPCTSPVLTLTPAAPTLTHLGAIVSGSGSNIVYKYATLNNKPVFGLDIVDFTLTCGGLTQSGTLFITVVSCPDNVKQLDCVDEKLLGFPFAIKEAWTSKENMVSTYQSPMVGDLDGDGIPDIVVAKHVSGGIYSATCREFKDLYVYKGSDRNNPVTIPTVSGNYHQTGAYAIARVPVASGDTVAMIVMHGMDGFLYCHTLPGVPNPWVASGGKSSHQITAPYEKKLDRGGVAFADFDNCGTPEIYIGNRIFNAATGQLLVDGNLFGTNKGKTLAVDLDPGDPLITSTSPSGYLYHPTAADIDGDGKLEYIAGNRIYEVNIATRTGSNPHLNTGNNMQLLVQSDPIVVNGKTVTDGVTAVADFTGNGQLNVLVATITAPTEVAIAIWDVQTKKVLGTMVQSTVESTFGIPFIGDIDANGKLEILMTTRPHTTLQIGDLNGFRLESTGPSTYTLANRYFFRNGDRSGSTGITLFDFNQSGEARLVYRDEDTLRIMRAQPVPNGVGGFNIDAKFAAGSGTRYEYAIVADVDADGAAEIVVTGGASNAPNGTVRIYKSGNEYNWAPARGVWNQYNYNVVNVNEDLTIPKYQMNLAKYFPNGKQPFNNYLQQQTWLDLNGEPYRLLANIVWEKPDPTVTYDGDSLVFEGCIKNIGDVALQKPFYVAYYKNDTIQSNLIAIDSVDHVIMKNSTYCFRLVLKNLSTLPNGTDLNTVWLSINDKGTGKYPCQGQCEVDGRREFKLRNFRWWYISSPYKNSNPGAFDIPAGTLGNITGSMLGYYNEEPKQYTSPLISIANFVPGRGIAASLDTMVVDFKPPTMATFARGITPVANDGDITVSVFNTDIVPAHSAKRGINLLGNPYPSHINFNAFYNSNSTKIENTMWIRGWNRTITPATPEGLMMYDTYNAASGAGTKLINDISITSDIPPIQGFWVKAKLPGEQTVTFMNTHKTSGTQILRAPAADVNRIARIRISATATNAQDEMLIVFNPAASNGYDLYDSEKMSHGSANIPELYSRVENRELVINGMQPVINKKVEIPLGFRTGKAGENFKISATFENWDNTEVRFLDYGIQKYAILTEGDVYQFEAKGGIYPNRFTLLIDGTPNNINSIENNITFIYVNDANRIAVNTDVNNATCTVYSIIGQKLAEETIVSNPQILNCIFEAGIYLVKVGNKTEKIIIR